MLATWRCLLSTRQAAWTSSDKFNFASDTIVAPVITYMSSAFSHPPQSCLIPLLLHHLPPSPALSPFSPSSSSFHPHLFVASLGSAKQHSFIHTSVQNRGSLTTMTVIPFKWFSQKCWQENCSQIHRLFHDIRRSYSMHHSHVGTMLKIHSLAYRWNPVTNGVYAAAYTFLSRFLKKKFPLKLYINLTLTIRGSFEPA